MASESHGEICKTDPCERCEEARLRHLEALQHIQRAQNELNAACERLAGLVGALPEWTRAGNMADRVKALWYAVEKKRDRVTLDSISSVRKTG